MKGHPARFESGARALERGARLLVAMAQKLELPAQKLRPPRRPRSLFALDRAHAARHPLEQRRPSASRRRKLRRRAQPLGVWALERQPLDELTRADRERRLEAAQRGVRLADIQIVKDTVVQPIGE